MEISARDRLRRGVRAAVYRACWRRLEGDEPGAQAVLACEVPAAIAHEGASTVDDELLRAWLDEDTADFDRAVLVSELISRRSSISPAPATVPRVRDPILVPERGPRAVAGTTPAIADLLDGMLAQERRMRPAS